MASTGPRYAKEEFARRGETIYREKIRPQLTDKDRGRFVAIDIETGEFEIADERMAASDKLRARIPDPQTWMVRVGYRGTVSFGGSHPRAEL